jgi:ATP-independent RNA helicase DbpA
MDYKAIEARFNITELNEMQRGAMEAIPKPGDVVLISPTGSGKTLAFLLPLLQLLDAEATHVQVLILVPSRELAIQIEKVFKQMGTPFKINCCYGGHAVGVEENNLKHPPAVLVGTPGRIGHHLRKKNLSLASTRTLVLDEFDKSLEFGFAAEMEFILSQCRRLTKRILISATELKEIPAFVGIQNSVVLNFTSAHPQSKPALEMRTVRAPGGDKPEALVLLLGKIGAKSTIVFCNHREAVMRISEHLREYGTEHGFYHGGLEQIDREKVLIKLRNGSIDLLISTDLASRGLDIPEIEVVIHYQMPASEDIMIHRNGRTARMHATGTAYFLLDKDDQLPEFLAVKPKEEPLPAEVVLRPSPPWKTLYIAAGKKDKINKMDIVGMLLQKGQLQKDELGKIEVLDYSAYAAVKADKMKRTLELIREEKIKGRKVKMEVSS